MGGSFVEWRSVGTWIRRGLVLGLSGLSLLVVGCSSEGENARFHIEIPRTLPSESVNHSTLESLSIQSDRETHSLKPQEVRASGAFMPGVIVVNVRYQATGPVQHQFQWQNPCMSDPRKTCALNFPSPVTVEAVKSGPQRLIQVMVVYFNETGKKRLLYGDLSRDLTPGTNEVSIPAAVFGDPAGSSETQIAGRYVSAVSSTYPEGYGPTGSMTMMFQPPSGRPMMDILKAEIFNGYFNVMALEGVPTVYRLDSTGEVLLKGLSVSQLATQVGSHLLRLRTPEVFYRNFHPEEEDFEPQEGSEVFFGFFGPGVAALTSPTVCYPIEDDMAVPYAYRSPSESDPLHWNGTTAEEGHFNRVGGGVPLGNGPCEGSTWTARKFFFNPLQIVNGKDSVMGFRGAIIYDDHDFGSQGELCNHSGFAVGCWDEAAGEMEYRWSYLPKVFEGPGALSGITLFEKVVSSDESSETLRYNGMRDGFRCSEFESIGFQATHFKPTDSTTYRRSLVPEPDTQIFAVLCPYKTVDGIRTYFDSGARFHDLHFYAQDGGDGGSSFVEPTGSSVRIDFLGSLETGFSFARGSSATVREIGGTLFLDTNFDEPRFEGGGVPSAEPYGLLIEPPSSNLIYNSADLNVNWTPVGVIVEVDASGDSPLGAGANFAEKIIDDSPEAGPHYLGYDLFGLSEGSDYTFSVYLKADTSNSAVIWFFEAGVQGPSVEVNLVNGEIRSTELGYATHSGVEPLANGWYRVWLALTKGSGTNISARIIPQFSAGYGLVRDDSSSGGSIYAWGAQVEEGIGPTSYIETEGLQEFRQPDKLTVNPGIAGYSVKYGTFAVEFQIPHLQSGAEQVVLNLRGSDPDEYVSFSYRAEDDFGTWRPRAQIKVNSANNYLYEDTHIGEFFKEGEIQRVAISFDEIAQQVIFSHGGWQTTIQFSSEYPPYNLIEIGHRNEIDQMTGWIRGVIQFSESLTEEELNSVTNPISPYFDFFNTF